MPNSYSLDLESGSSQFASITDAAQTGLDITGALSVEAWVKIESDTAAQQIIAGKGDNSAYSALCYSLSLVSLVPRFAIASGAVGDLIDGATTLLTGTWYHIAGVYVPSTSMTVYLDGTQDGQNTTNIDASIQDLTTKDFAIGRDSNAASRFLDGLVDEIRVWNDERTGTEISDNYRRQLIGNEANLQGYWRLNNDYLDQTANNNDLTASGSPVFSTDVPFRGGGYLDLISKRW